MDIYIVKGKIYKVLPLQQKTDRFRKQEVVIQVTNPTDKGTFVEFIRLQCINDKISLIDGAEKGQQVVCKFTISGRKTGKDDEEIFYTNLDVVDLSIINKAEDIIKSDIRPGSKGYKDQFPGLNDDDDIGSDIPGNKEPDDLPF